MSRNRKLARERNKLIKDLYTKYASEYVLGPKGQRYEKYKHDAILAMVAKRFFLEPATIGNILCHKDDEQDEESPNQLDLFNAE